MWGAKREDKVPAKKAGRAKIQAATLSELCRIVSPSQYIAPRMDKSNIHGEKGSRALGQWAKAMEDGKNLEHR
jgi:hypothetical protein